MHIVSARGKKRIKATNIHCNYGDFESKLSAFHFSTYKVIADNHDIFCMDSTHKTVKGIKKVRLEEGRMTFKSAYLFTLLVKDCTIKKGIPVAFMISSSESRCAGSICDSLGCNDQYLISTSSIHRYLIQHWLHWLKNECGLKTAAFMVDCALTESEAISSVFPHSRIFYCDFHVAQLWERHLKLKSLVRQRFCCQDKLPTAALVQYFQLVPLVIPIIARITSRER